jgi:GNAT superfamily N-acetyltransferase
VIRLCEPHDADAMYEIINDSARAYQGQIPEDRYQEPYMPREELLAEIADGVVFYGYEDQGRLVAVMGIQDKGPVVLVRHSYTVTREQGKGIGSRLLDHLLAMAGKPVLIGTWRDATWAIRFYEKHGFTVTNEEQTRWLLRTFWSIPERQVETSVVLVDGEGRELLASGWPT